MHSAFRPGSLRMSNPDEKFKLMKEKAKLHSREAHGEAGGVGAAETTQTSGLLGSGRTMAAGSLSQF